MVSIHQEFMEKRFFLERTKYSYYFDGGFSSKQKFFNIKFFKMKKKFLMLKQILMLKKDFNVKKIFMIKNLFRLEWKYLKQIS